MYSNSLVAKKYSLVLYNAALEDKALEAVAADMDRLFTKLKNNRQYQYFVMSKSAPAKTKFMFFNTAIEDLKLHKITRAFLELIISKNRMHAMWDIKYAYEALLRQNKGEEAVLLELAYEPTSAMLKELEKALADALHKKIDLAYRVNPQLLGGMVIKYGAKMLDLSIARKLRKIAKFALS